MARFSTFPNSMRLWLFAGVLLLSAGGCVEPLPAAGGSTFQITTKNPQDQVAVAMVGTRADVDVFSPTGIGAAVVALESGERPASLAMRYHLKGLEELRFTYGDKTIQVSASSRPDAPVLESVVTAEGEQPISAGSPFWMQVEWVDGKAQRTTGGYFLVWAPQDFDSANPWKFDISWIDFYR